MTNRETHIWPLEQSLLYDNTALREAMEKSTGLAVAMVHSGWSDGGIAGSVHWFASSSQAGIVECGQCGNTYNLEVGEEIDFSDPRMCEHGPSRA